MSKMSNSILIHNIAAKYILEDKNLDVDIRGSEEKTKILLSLLETSKKAYNIIKQKKYSKEELSKILDEKRELAQKFKDLSGIDWRL